MVEAPAITEVTMSGPGAGGVETASAVLGDLVSILAGEAPAHVAEEDLPIVADVASSFYLHLEVADEPGVLARIAQVLGENEISVKSVVQRGFGEDARLVMVVHECLESRFMSAVEEIGRARRPALRPALHPGDRGGVRVTAPANRRISASSVGRIGSRTKKCAPLTDLPASTDLLGFRSRQ